MRLRMGVVLLATAVPFMGERDLSGDVTTHFTGGFGTDVPVLLDQVGIGRWNGPSETTAEGFVVPGAGAVKLAFHFRRDTGGFLFAFGYFDLDTVNADPVRDKQRWATQALRNAILVFDDRLDDPGATTTRVVQGGARLGFFLIPNNSLQEFVAKPSRFYPPQARSDDFRAPHFSVSDANPGQLDQLLSFTGNGITLFTFEDLTRIGETDADFTDLAFTVDAELLPIREGPPLPTHSR